MIKRNLFLFLIIISCAGCYSINDYNFSALREINKNIVKEDGINSIEAVYIAQQYIYEHSLHHRMYSMTPYRVRLKKEPDELGRFVYLAQPKRGTIDYLGAKRWEIQFRDKEGSLFWGVYPIVPFYVDVDADSAEVLASGSLR